MTTQRNQNSTSPATPETGHTRGPWHVSKSGAGVLAVYAKRRQSPVCVFGNLSDDLAPDFPTAEANARLIAAAPELLAALRWIAEHGDTGAGGRPAYHDMRAHARAAIAKAEGKIP